MKKRTTIKAKDNRLKKHSKTQKKKGKWAKGVACERRKGQSKKKKQKEIGKR